jgi:hypothetical protein
MIEQISREQLRSFMLETLRQQPEGQLGSLYGSLAIVMHQQLHGKPPERQISLSREQAEHAGDLAWDLIIEGVIRPGTNFMNPNLPFYHVTEMGQRIIKDSHTSPYDPDGYLKRLQAAVPKMDPIILTYLNESLHTFRIGCILSSTITLGVASEQALLLLIDAYIDALPLTRKENFRKKVEGQIVKRQYEELIKMVNSHLRGLLPSDVKENLDAALTSIFNLLRTHRNEAGHPSGKILEREEAYANIRVFPMYVAKVYQLIDWLQANKPLS